MHDRKDQLIEVIEVLVKQIATEDKKQVRETYQTLQTLFMQLNSTDQIKQEIYECVYSEIFLNVFKGKYTFYADAKPGEIYWLSDVIEEGNLPHFTKVIATLSHCINELNSGHYFFMEGKRFSVSDLLNKHGTLHFIIYQLLEATDTNRDDLYKKMFSYVLSLGANINLDDNPYTKNDPERESLFMWSPIRALPFLLENKADPNQPGKGRMPICEFISKTQWEGIEFLLNANSEYKKVDVHENTIFHKAVELSATQERKKADILKQVKNIFEKFPQLLVQPNKHGDLPLLFALVDGEPEIVTFILEKYEELHLPLNESLKNDIFQRLLVKIKDCHDHPNDEHFAYHMERLKQNFNVIYPLWGMPIDLEAFLKDHQSDNFSNYLKHLIHEPETKMMQVGYPLFKQSLEFRGFADKHALPILWKTVSQLGTYGPEDDKDFKPHSLGK